VGRVSERVNAAAELVGTFRTHAPKYPAAASEFTHSSMPGTLITIGILCFVGQQSAASPSGAADRIELADYHGATRDAVNRVLAEPEFADLRRDVQSWWMALLQWLERTVLGIGRWFDRIPSWLWWTIVIWLILTLLAIFAHFAYVLWGMIVSSAARRGPAGESPSGRGELLGIRDLEFDSVYRRARELLSSREWAQATKYLYVAAILWLDRQGWAQFKSSKTDYDYLRELSDRPRSRQAFRDLTNRFESTVYGGVPSTADLCQEMTSLLDHLFREADPVVSL